MVKPVDGARPQQIRPSTAEAAAPLAPVKLDAPIVEGTLGKALEGFDLKKKKPVSITGGHKAHSPNPQLPTFSPQSILRADSSVGAGVTLSAAMPADVGKLLKSGSTIPLSAKGEFSKDDIKATNKGMADAQASIAKGNYGEAYKKLEETLRKHEEVLDGALPAGTVASTNTVKDQMEFLAKMKAANVDPVSYPPQMSELVQYFGKLKEKPDQARQAFQDYAKDFHVHPANVPGADFDVKYSQDKTVTARNVDVTTSVPNDWSEVSNRSPGPNAKPESIGKQMNDCEGFAFMAEKLLGAAGFKVADNVTVGNTNSGEHQMVAFTHPPEKGFTVTSNDQVFTDPTEKGAARKGYDYASGGNVTGKEVFFKGKTMQDSQVSAESKGPHL